jgi:hypothetical protein
MESPANHVKQKPQGLILSLVISIGGYFANFLVFAVSYAFNRVILSDEDISVEDPTKDTIKIIMLIVGLIFPFISGYYFGRKNIKNKTNAHYLICVATGLYVFYLAEGQFHIAFVAIFSILAMLTVMAGFKLATRKQITA